MEYVECVGQNQIKPELVGALPPGALDWRPQHLDMMKLGSYYARLSKDRLTGNWGVFNIIGNPALIQGLIFYV